MHDNKQLLCNLFQAYYDARKNKRNTINALAFEIDYESRLFRLYEDIVNRRYRIGPIICFIVNRPVKREIFAADFRDRVVHHLLYNYLSPLFERRFLPDSYACRAGKGTHTASSGLIISSA
jgi:retron-type reverse transcriptase